MQSRRPHTLLALLLVALTIISAHRAAAGETPKVVIPFDLTSKFDSGRYGQIVGELIWKKLDGQGRFVIPETMLDVRDTCAANQRRPSPELDIDAIGKIIRDDFGADVGIWGSVERAPGHEWDVYDLVIRCVDFTAEANPKIVFECNVRTKTVSEIPDVYVQRMLDALLGREPTDPPPSNPAAEENWRNGPNLVQGDFQRGSGNVPAGWAPDWEAGQVDQREPLGKTVQWIAESGNTTNRVIRFTLTRPLAEGTGVAYYSDFLPVDEGATYRFQCRWRSDGPEVKVFIKCYDEVPTAESPGASPGPSPSRRTETREVYRSQQNLKPPRETPAGDPTDTWHMHTQDFTPRHEQHTPRRGRVMLYAYLHPGQVEFDDVVVKQILPTSPGKKDR